MRVDSERGRALLTELHEVAADLQDEIDQMPDGSVGAKRKAKLRTTLILDVGVALSIRYPLGTNDVAT